MNLLAELDQFDLDSATKNQVVVLIHALLDQAANQATEQLQAKDALIKTKDIKIEALTFELAHLRRIRFGVKNEALTVIQHYLFKEDQNTDIAAIEAEIEQLVDPQPSSTVAKPKRPRAGRQLCLIICRALWYAMNRKTVPASCAATLS